MHLCTMREICSKNSVDHKAYSTISLSMKTHTNNGCFSHEEYPRKLVLLAMLQSKLPFQHVSPGRNHNGLNEFYCQSF